MTVWPTQGSFGFLPKIGQKTQAAPKSLALDWTLDCRIIASFRAHGGILADEILGRFRDVRCGWMSFWEGVVDRINAEVGSIYGLVVSPTHKWNILG